MYNKCIPSSQLHKALHLDHDSISSQALIYSYRQYRGSLLATPQCQMFPS